MWQWSVCVCMYMCTAHWLDDVCVASFFPQNIAKEKNLCLTYELWNPSIIYHCAPSPSLDRQALLSPLLFIILRRRHRRNQREKKILPHGERVVPIGPLKCPPLYQTPLGTLGPIPSSSNSWCSPSPHRKGACAGERREEGSKGK